MSQERRLMRRLNGGAGQVSPGLPQWTPQDEQDGKRDRLAERLLEILTEEVIGYDEEGTTLRDQMGDAAHAALAAAEVVYPDLPGAESEMVPTRYAAAVAEADLLRAEDFLRAAQAPPPAAQAGLESVIVRQNDAQGTVREGAWLMTAEEYARRLAAGEVGTRLVLIDHSQDADATEGEA